MQIKDPSNLCQSNQVFETQKEIQLERQPSKCRSSIHAENLHFFLRIRAVTRNVENEVWKRDFAEEI